MKNNIIYILQVKVLNSNKTIMILSKSIDFKQNNWFLNKVLGDRSYIMMGTAVNSNKMVRIGDVGWPTAIPYTFFKLSFSLSLFHLLLNYSIVILAGNIYFITLMNIFTSRKNRGFFYWNSKRRTWQNKKIILYNNNNTLPLYYIINLLKNKVSIYTYF